MEVAVVQIGNSKGICLSKTILKKYNIKDKGWAFIDSKVKAVDLINNRSDNE